MLRAAGWRAGIKGGLRKGREKERGDHRAVRRCNEIEREGFVMLKKVGRKKKQRKGNRLIRGEGLRRSGIEDKSDLVKKIEPRQKEKKKKCIVERKV